MVTMTQTVNENVQSPATIFTLKKTNPLDAAIGDLTGIGAIYNIGCELANLNRNHRMAAYVHEFEPQNSSSNPLAKRFLRLLDCERSSIRNSILTKIAYLASLSTTTVGLYYGLPIRFVEIATTIGIGTYILGKAGYDSVVADKNVGDLCDACNCFHRQTVESSRGVK